MITNSSDLLYGASSVADHLGMKERQARYLIEKGTLPSFKIDGKVCCSKAAIDAWIKKKQAEAETDAAACEAAADAGKAKSR